MNIQWLGLSCFRLRAGGSTLVIDPFDGVRGYGEVSTAANSVFKSHDHGDHAFLEGVCLEWEEKSAFTVRAFPSFHDDAGGKKRGNNTIHLIEAEGFRVVHLGDLGHLPDANTTAQLQGCDLLLIPVGGFYTIDAPTAQRVCRLLAPKAVTPMHYRHGEYGHAPIGTLDAFLDLFPAEEITRLSGNSFDLPQSGIVVPQFVK